MLDFRRSPLDSRNEITPESPLRGVSGTWGHNAAQASQTMAASGFQLGGELGLSIFRYIYHAVPARIADQTVPVASSSR